MSIRITQNSFSKGILSPSLQGRVDLEQYKLGLKNLTNGIVLQEGCVQNRPGLEYLAKCKYEDKKTRIIPFIFNFNQNYILEFGHKYIRFLKDGGYILDEDNEIYEIASPYDEQDLFEINYCQNMDSISLVHENYSPYELTRIEHNNWQLNKIEFKSAIETPNNVQAIYTGSTSANTTVYEYVVCAVDKDTLEESTSSQIASVTGHKEGYWTTSEYITISWDEVANASQYNIYRSVNGLFGYLGTASNGKTTFKDDNIEPDLTSCAPIFKNPFENENPSSVCFFQERKIYSGGSKSPQTLFASQSGTNNNFNISHLLNATDSINVTIHDNAPGKIKHLVPFDDLIVMTTNAEWIVNGTDGVFCANPAPVAKLQTYYGTSSIKPVISGSMVLFVQSGGNIVRDLGFDYYSNSYNGEELTLLASHLFEGKKIVDMGYLKEPNRLLICVLDDGTLNILTYNKTQKIAAWHTHKTKGSFESVAIIREGSEDTAYFVIKRTINSKEVRYIERFTSRVVKRMDEAFFLDCALKKTFDNKVQKISGLEHLKGEKVNAVLDYGVVQDLIIDENGTLTLPYKAKNITIGLPYAFEMETLNIEGQGTLGLKKIINKVEIKILDSREELKIQNDNSGFSLSARSKESVDFPEKLFNKDVELCPMKNASIQSSIKIIQDLPLPLTILSIEATISLEEVEST